MEFRVRIWIFRITYSRIRIRIWNCRVLKIQWIRITDNLDHLLRCTIFKIFPSYLICFIEIEAYFARLCLWWWLLSSPCWWNGASTWRPSTASSSPASTASLFSWPPGGWSPAYSRSGSLEIKTPQMQCCGFGMFIPDPESKRFRIPDSDPHQRI